MATIDVNSISNAQLKQLATEIDNSNVSAKDNKIDDTEFGIFQQMAKTYLLDKKEITNADYKAIFGLEKANDKVNADSLANEQIRKNVAKTDSIARVEIAKKESIDEDKKIKAQMIREAILSLENSIDSMENSLYKGKYDDIKNTLAFSREYTIDCSLEGAGIGACATALPAVITFFILLEEVGAAALFGIPGAIIAGGALLGAIGGGIYGIVDNLVYGDGKRRQFLRNCKRENPELYKALKEARKQLAKLQKQLAKLQK